MSDAGLRIWCVSDGRAGIERQTLAIAAALSEVRTCLIETLRLQPRGVQLLLPPQSWPAPLAALPSDQRAALRPDAGWPDVWIGNGRRSIPYSLRAKAWSGGRSLVVQVQNPRVALSLFDLVVPPRHDQVVGANVVETLGAPVWFTHAQLEAARGAIAPLPQDGLANVMVVLGGPSRRHRFGLEQAEALTKSLAPLLQQGVRLLITTSRRTPQAVVDLFRAWAGELGAQAKFFADEARDGPNPYLAWLQVASAVLVTEDSTNMMTDAAFFGLPIHLLRLAGGDARFDRLHEAFIAAGCARWFDGDLTPWTYPPIRDADVVARAILARLST
jgi:mitochondrial fission protein ELM1